MYALNFASILSHHVFKDCFFLILPHTVLLAITHWLKLFVSDLFHDLKNELKNKHQKTQAVENTWWKQTLPTTQHIEEPSSEGMFQGRQPQRFSASWAFQRKLHGMCVIVCVIENLRSIKVIILSLRKNGWRSLNIHCGEIILIKIIKFHDSK